ncbi:MAG: hypothetical protein JXB05_27985 [Myxococcaceae bacterium]|nr:hypothetical protein [Myxococcaceae bacterium]
MKMESIKKEILSEHSGLRRILINVSTLAERVSAEDVSAEPALREGAHQLAAELTRHMESEERHLAALSRGGSPRWAEHLRDFKHHHLHQRDLLTHFLQRVDSIQVSRRLGEIIQAMATAVLIDMEHEELVLFTPESIASGVHGA